MEKEKKLLLAPSMGCCDLYDFEHQVRFIDEHADFLHIDIKDGNYVKTFGVGPDFMTVLKKVVKKPMDAHLMVKHPQDYIEACAEAGAAYITPHTDGIESWNCIESGCSAGRNQTLSSIIIESNNHDRGCRICRTESHHADV